MIRYDDAPDGGTYALRVAGRVGWRLEWSLLSKAALADHLRDRGEAVEEVVVIAPGGGGGEHGDFMLLWVALNYGWCFDALADCWRAPGEMPTPFPGIPQPVERVEVHYTLPTGFSMPIRITAGGQSAGFEVSNTWDPIPDIAPWLERVLDGGYARLSIDLDGEYAELHVFPVEPGVRLVVCLSEEDWRNVIDVTLPRMAVIEGFYRPLVTLWESWEMLHHGWPCWHFELAVGAKGLTEEDMRPYPVRSARIDAALGMEPGGGGGVR
jgi:hypothetical protein